MQNFRVSRRLTTPCSRKEGIYSPGYVAEHDYIPSRIYPSRHCVIPGWIPTAASEMVKRGRLQISPKPYMRCLSYILLFLFRCHILSLAPTIISLIWSAKVWLGIVIGYMGADVSSVHDINITLVTRGTMDGPIK
jgi:hypothetical protein